MSARRVGRPAERRPSPPAAFATRMGSAARYLGRMTHDAASDDGPQVAPAHDWPDAQDWVWQGPLGAPGTWGTPGLVMAFNLECPGCISRGIPFLKRLQEEHGDALQLALLHTAYGHRDLPRDGVEPELLRFADRFARLTMPIALDVSGERARRWGTEGTPHWFAFDADGTLVRSVYGSQENAQARLAYLLDELVQAPAS